MRISLCSCSVAAAIIVAIVFGFPRATYPLFAPEVAYASTLLPQPDLIGAIVVPDTPTNISDAAAQTQPENPPKPKPGAAQSSADASSPIPARLIIPSISLNSPIDPVGTDATGAMAVPSGSSDHVGWYSKGAVPGEIGTAVLDAHVFAAFANLKYLKPGSDIYIETLGGATEHFVVDAAQTFPLAGLDPSQLFGNSGGRDLNLITCAGELTPDHSTYDHRLIVYTHLAS